MKVQITFISANSRLRIFFSSIVSMIRYIIILLLITAPNIGIAQLQEYANGYFKLLDYFIRYPYDFLGKTEFELLSLQKAPPSIPINNEYWSVQLQKAEQQADYGSYVTIRTGYSPVHVFFGRVQQLSFGFQYPGSKSLEITIDVIKNHFNEKQISFNKFGNSGIMNDYLDRGKYIIRLTAINDTPVIMFYPVDSSGKFLFSD
jgi:hypothetical protein